MTVKGIELTNIQGGNTDAGKLHGLQLQAG